MKKVIVIIVVIVVAVVAVGTYYLLANLNTIVAKAIEKDGSKATGTSVRVSGVDIALRDARASVKGLRVANPEGFHASDAFSLEGITVGIDVKSVRENPIVIDEIRVQSPVVFAEVTKTGSTNIAELRKRIEAATGASGETDGQAKRIRVNRFILDRGRIELDASALGLEKQTIALPEMSLNDIGGPGGAPPAEVAKVILTAVAREAASQIADSEANRLIEKKLGGSVEEEAKGLLEKIVK